MFNKTNSYMCKFLIFFLLSCPVLLSSISATDTIRLNMQAYMENYLQDKDGKWVDTYNYGILSLDFGDFQFSHVTNAMQMQGTDPNGMQYWDGFTVCTNGDDLDYGYAGSSTDWVTHQWGCMAGGGLDSLWRFVKGAPYLVGYWGYNYEEEGVRSLRVDFADGMTHLPLGIWVCNHPWPYYGIQHDDAFAHSFADNGSQFRLIIHGLDEEEKDTGMPIMHKLAWFHNNELDISSNWHWIDLRSLGQVNAIYFTMESTDASGVLGMNTAAFFCFGGMEMLEHIDMIGRPAGLEAEPIDEHSVKVTWKNVDEAVYYRLYVDSMLVDSTETNKYTFTGLETYTSYRFFAEAVSATGERSDWGYVQARTKDLTLPTPPTNLRTIEVGMYKIVLTWDAGTDNVGVGRYVVYVNGKKYSRPQYTTITITGLDPGTDYLIEVETLDTSDNASERASIQVTTTTTTPTAIEQTSAQGSRNIYTIHGQSLPQKNMQRGKMYIVQKGNETTKQIIQ